MTDPDYFTLVELRALPDCSDFQDADILAAAAYFVAIVEREVGRPFIPRTYTDTLDGANRRSLTLSQGSIRSLTSVTVDGVAVNTALLATTSGVLRYLGYTTWIWSGVQSANVVVTYVAGKYATCPDDIKNATMWATRDRLLSQSSAAGIDTRATSMTNDLGGTTTYMLPGEKRPTGYPDLDALIASYCRNVPSLGFA
jgi:hypothetical protein